jgi:hypothetical protein
MQGDRTRRLASFTVFNLLMAFFPLTTLVVSNDYLLWQPLTAEMRWLVGFFAVIFVLNQGVYLLFRRERVHLLFYFFVFLLFAWNPVLQIVGNRGVFGVACYLAAVVPLFLLGFRGSRSVRFARVLTTILFVFSVFPVLRIVLLLPGGARAAGDFDLRPDHRDRAAFQATAPAPRFTPDVYLLIFDCMASTQQFLEAIDASDDSRRRLAGFEAEMRSFGYSHLEEAWSNYERTSSSMGSFFKFDYHHGDIRWFLRYHGFVGSPMWRYFKDSGYDVIARQLDIPCPDELDECFRLTNQLELVSILAGSTPAWYFIYRIDKYLFTPMEWSVLRRLSARLTSMKLEEVSQFIDYLDEKPPSDRPELVYAHFQASHPPNFYDKDCDTESLTLFEQRSGEDRTQPFSFTRYGSEYLCFLQQIAEVARAIERKDPDAWVIVLSDHGYGTQSYGLDSPAPWDKERLDATFRILNLVKAPPSCVRRLASAKTIVNKARGLVNCLSDGEVAPYLPERVDVRFFGVDAMFTIGSDGYEDAVPHPGMSGAAVPRSGG